MISNALSPAQFCELQSALFLEKSFPKTRKTRGQFFTPLPVARFMAGLADYHEKTLRVLDAGAGTAILSCAVCEAVAKRKAVEKIEIDAYEDDPQLAGLARNCLDLAGHWLAEQGIELSYQVVEEDFILSFPQGLWAKEIIPYDLAIGNPPYFKIGKNDPRAVSTSRFVHGQPNIYTLFMGVTAELLRDKGVMIVITPRSYAAGPYFRLFRQRFFDMMQPERVHLFESRKDAFRKDDVLQENIILKARKSGKPSMIKISLSRGMDDLDEPANYDLPISRVLYSTGKDIILRLPTSDLDIGIIDMVEEWTGNLHKYRLEISTGPVVPFRAENLILDGRQRDRTLVPLIWMQNVQAMKVQWPLFDTRNGKEKPQFIKANAESFKRKLLLPDQNMVLLRRFSAKEETRRLTAAPLLKGQLSSKLIGLENHVNYIYKPMGELNKTQAFGLAALLNSSWLDRYFRVSNGNTQVSATEIRAMPLPSLEVIEDIGHSIRLLDHVPTLEEIDNLVLSNICGNNLLNFAGGISGG
ncbi:MAG: Eco57I restriction-modification methylase domain-containing protein [Deltaproteobacteria bacterium]|nr:Eco57I restriction-modification methylase domain-containing protein [Deltaproteobacteria bacterium]